MHKYKITAKPEVKKILPPKKIPKNWSLSHHLKNLGICQSWFPSKSLRIKKLHQLEEVDLFIQQRKSNLPDVMDTLDFWVKSESLFPVLSKVACDVLVVPASLAPVERTFSIAENACIGKESAK